MEKPTRRVVFVLVALAVIGAAGSAAAASVMAPHTAMANPTVGAAMGAGAELPAVAPPPHQNSGGGCHHGFGSMWWG